MYWKGKIEPGTTCHKLASNIDLFPTVAELSGSPLPSRKIDGVSLTPLFSGAEGANPRESFVYYFNRNDLEAVTDGTFKLVFPHRYRTYGANAPGNDGKPGKLSSATVENNELYDLRRDPGERYNVISEYPDRTTRLLEIANAMREELGDELTGKQGTQRREPGYAKNH
jgi:arylsulfatase